MSTPQDSMSSALALFKRWQAGDRQALDQLAAEIQPWLHQEISLALGKNQRAAQDSVDMAQNAVLNFLTWGPKFVPENETQFRALLKRIATNQVIDMQRRQGLRNRGGHVESMLKSGNSFSNFGPTQNSALSPSHQAGQAEDQDWVRLALQFLEPDERHLLVASEVEGQDWATIASDLGLTSADAARVRCARLKPKLARLLMQLRRGRMPDAT